MKNLVIMTDIFFIDGLNSAIINVTIFLLMFYT